MNMIMNIQIPLVYNGTLLGPIIVEFQEQHQSMIEGVDNYCNYSNTDAIVLYSCYNNHRCQLFC